jgi:rod shape-determining protein MreD
MRWWAFAIVAFAGVVIETSVRQTLSIGGTSPSVLVCVAVYVSLFAPKRTALWACWVLGLLVDLVTVFAVSNEDALFVPGPHALGYVALCGVVLWLRGSVFRQRVLTISILTLGGAAVMGVVVVVISLVRSWYPEAEEIVYFAGGSAWRELWRGMGVAVYSAALALPLGWLLLTTLPLWKFETFGYRHVWR